MLEIFGRKHRRCDGHTRRSFLKIGGFALGCFGGLSLADILRAEAAAGNHAPQKAVINIFLDGGPSHQDMWEIKSGAPSEIRGEFKPISTSVPGIQIGEVFPQIAALMHKMVVIRSVIGSAGSHDGYQCLSGWPRRSIASIGGRPSIGPALAKLEGPVYPSVPATVALAERTRHVPWSEPGDPGFLGAAYRPFKPDKEGMANLRLNITPDRLQDRRALLESFSALDQTYEASGSHDKFNEAAFDVLTSSKLVDALDLSKEDPKIRERYGDGKPFHYQYDGAPTVNEHFLLARRLVEVGVRSVTLSYGRWDSHGKNFDLIRDHGSKLDQAVSALVEDLDVRGMLDDVTVVVWGEFGRTPKINNNAGRDHWPQVSCALMAGGGMRTGQAIGATNRLGEFPTKRPVNFQEVVATIYHNLGIDVSSTTLIDPTGRPQYLVSHGPMTELI